MMIAPGASAHDIAELRARYGLDQPFLVQFGIWLDGILHGNFGISISLRRNVLELLTERLPATLELAIVACALAVLLGGATAIAGTLIRRTRGEAVEKFQRVGGVDPIEDFDGTKLGEFLGGRPVQFPEQFFHAPPLFR